MSASETAAQVTATDEPKRYPEVVERVVWAAGRTPSAAPASATHGAGWWETVGDTARSLLDGLKNGWDALARLDSPGGQSA